MGLNASKKEEKAKINALNKDKKALEIKLSYPEGLLTEIGGQLRDEEAKKLILKKLYDWVSEQLTRYLNGEKRGLVAKVENLWDKYAVSSQEMEAQREQTLGELNEFLSKLRYLA
jgi:type I restriction enzyme M protein